MWKKFDPNIDMSEHANHKGKNMASQMVDSPIQKHKLPKYCSPIEIRANTKYSSETKMKIANLYF